MLRDDVVRDSSGLAFDADRDPELDVTGASYASYRRALVASDLEVIGGPVGDCVVGAAVVRLINASNKSASCTLAPALACQKSAILTERDLARVSSFVKAPGSEINRSTCRHR